MRRAVDKILRGSATKMTNKAMLETIETIGDVKMTDRTLRTIYKAINDDFIAGKTDKMVVSDELGSWLTNDEQEIRKFNKGRKNQALSLLKGVYRSEKRLNNDKNLSFEEWLDGNIQV